MRAPAMVLASLVLYALGPTATAAAGRWQESPQASSGLKIVVIKGEDAVNIIQQKTAVAPVVEVRDRNNLPVPGVAVTFTIGSGQGATFGGLSTLTVTTNAAGQAAAAGFAPTAAGAIQINATAVVQGQALAATITQTNVLTAAQAAAAGAGASGSGAGGGGAGGASGAAGGAGGGIGGISGATLGIIGGAVAGGAVVATKAAGGGDSTPTATTPTTTAVSNTPAPTPAPTPTPTPTPTPAPTPTPTPAPTPGPTTSSLTGPASGSYTVQSTTAVVDGTPVSCFVNYSLVATVKLALETRSDSSAAGTGDASVTLGAVSSTCGLLPADIGSGTVAFTGPITGTAGAMRFSQEITQNQSFQGVSVVSKITLTFTGALSNGVVTGSITMSHTTAVDGQGITGRGTGTGTYSITLR